MTEYFDLYTADRRRLGRKIQRGAPIPHGEYHIVVQIMTVNSQGKILLTQRVPQKTSGGRWECSGGCAVSGETSREAAVRELFEETGIKADPGEISLEWTLTTDSMLRDFYIVHKDVGLDRLDLQSSEVCAAKWVSFSRLEEMAQNGQTTRTVAKWLENRGGELRRKVMEISSGIDALDKAE
ncbi:MAG: NUDIX domain-containing protein [Oscillospiraceae bacterium]|nr:NUDIX domain-containing protein [Oscillospiraceae bacterium]